MKIGEAWEKAANRAERVREALQRNADDITVANAFKELLDVLELIGRADHHGITLFAYADTAKKLLLKGVNNARKVAIETMLTIRKDALEKAEDPTA